MKKQKILSKLAALAAVVSVIGARLYQCDEVST